MLYGNGKFSHSNGRELMLNLTEGTYTPAATQAIKPYAKNSGTVVSSNMTPASRLQRTSSWIELASLSQTRAEDYTELTSRQDRPLLPMSASACLVCMCVCVLCTFPEGY